MFVCIVVFPYIVSFSFISDFEGAMPARYLRHGAQPEVVPEIKEMPQLQPYWAAGFSFSRGHFKVRVPYDAYQPMVFQVLSLRFFCFYFSFLYQGRRDSNRNKRFYLWI
jgi:hypothetical protein